MYLAARINLKHYPSTQIRIDKGRAEIELDVDPDYHHALNAMHGSIYFKLLDDAAFFAVNSVVEDVFVLTVSFNIKFFRPVSTGKLRAEGKLISTGDGRYRAEAILCNADEQKIASGSGEFARSKTQLSKDIGYY